MKNKLILILFLALSLPASQVVHANSSSATEAKFKNADTVVKKLVDIRAAVNNFYDKNTAWPSSLSVLNSSGFYSGDFKTTFNGTIVGSVSGSEYKLTVNVLDEKVAAYVARMVAGSNSDSVVNMPIPRPVTQAINNTFISRFFDPARPDLNEMSTNLSLGGNNINNINTANALVLNANDLNVAQKAIIATADIANANLAIATVDQAVIANSALKNTNIETGQAKQLVVSNSLHSKNNTVIDGSLKVNAIAEFLNNTNFTKPVTFKDIAGSNAVITTLTVENGQAKQLTVNDLNSTTANTDKLLANAINSKTIANTGSLTNQGSATINGGLAVSGGAKFDNVTVSGKTQSGSTGTGELIVTGGSDLKGNVTARGKVQTLSGLSNAGGLTTDTLAVTGESVTTGLKNNGNFTNTGDVVIAGKTTIQSSLESQSGIKNIGGVQTDTLNVSGTSKAGSLLVEGSTELQGPVLSKGQLSSKSGIVNSGGLSTDTLNVSGKSQLNGQLTTNNGIANTGGLRTDTANIDGLIEAGTLKVNRTADVLGSVTFQDTFLAKGKVTFQSGLSNRGGLSTDSLNVAGASSVNNLTAQGSSEFKSTVDVGGKLTTANGITNRGGFVTDTINVLNTLVVDGAGNFKDEVLFDGPLKINRKISVTGGNHQNLNITNDFDSLSIGIKKDSVEFVSNSNNFIFNNKVSAQGFYDTDSETYLDSGVLNLAGAPTSTIEIRSSSGKSKIDFSNDSITDFDARLELTSNDRLSVLGADFFASKIIANTVVADGYYVKDTRNDASKPSDYKKQVSFEFKNRSVTGAPGNSTYSGVTTFAPWSDSSGGHNYQTSYSTKNNIATLAIRSGLSTGNWSSWSQVFTDNYHPNADRLTTARAINLSGDMIGTVQFDGSKNVTIKAEHQMDASDLNLGNVKNYGISDRFDWNNSNSYASSKAVYSAHQNILGKLKSYYTSAQVDSKFFNRTQSDARYYNIGEVTKATVKLDQVNNYGISDRFDWNNSNSYASSKAVYSAHQNILEKMKSYYTIAQIDSNFFNRTQSDARYYNIGEVTKATVKLDQVNNYGISDRFDWNNSNSYASSKAVHDLNSAIQNKFKSYYTIKAANDNFYSRSQADDLFFNKTLSDARYYNIGEVTKATVNLDNVENYGISNSFTLNSSYSYASSKAVHDLNSAIQNKFKSYYTIRAVNDNFYNRDQADDRFYNIGEVTKATVNLDRVGNYGITDNFNLKSSEMYASAKAVSDLRDYVARDYVDFNTGDERYYTKTAANDNFYSKAQVDTLFYNRNQADARYYNIGEVTKATVNLDKVGNYGITDNFNLKSSEMYASAKAVSDLRDYVARDYVDFNTGDERYYTITAANDKFYSKEQVNTSFYNRSQADARYYNIGEVTKATVNLENVANYKISNSYTLNSAQSYASSKAVHDLKTYVDSVSGKGLKVHDSRSIAPKPNDYKNEVLYEFKHRSVVGAPGDSTFAGIRTFAPWSDSSGGHAYQTAFTTQNGKPVMSIRSGDLSSSTWGRWSRILDEETANQFYYRKNDDISVYNSSPQVQIRSSSSTNPILRFTKQSANADIEFDGSSIKLNDDVFVKNSLTVGSTIIGSHITAKQTLRADDDLIVAKNASVGGSVTFEGNLTKKGIYTIGTSADNRIYWAPYQNGSYQWGKEFGFNPAINAWYAETKFRTDALEVAASSKWILKAVPNNIQAYYDGGLAWQVASNKIIHHKTTEFRENASFSKDLSVSNLLTTNKLLVTNNAEVRGDLHVGGDINISGVGSLKAKLNEIEADSTSTANDVFMAEILVGLNHSFPSVQVCKGTPLENKPDVSETLVVDFTNHPSTKNIFVEIHHVMEVHGTKSNENPTLFDYGQYKIKNLTTGKYLPTKKVWGSHVEGELQQLWPFTIFETIKGGSQYAIEFIYRITNPTTNNCFKWVMYSDKTGLVFSATPKSHSIRDDI